MRRILVAATLAFTTVGTAMAAQHDESAAGRVYLGFNFGGAQVAPRGLHFGLRLDYDTPYQNRLEAPAVMQFDFTRAGLASAKVNGLSVLKKGYLLKQNADEEVPAEESAAPAEEAPAESAAAPESAPAEAAPTEAAAAAPAEEPGFLSRSWSNVKGFFGFGGDDAAATETAAADAPADTPAENPADVAEGTFMGYNAVDWTMLAVGAVGLGFVAAEVKNGDEDGEQQATAPSSGDGGSGLPIDLPLPDVGLGGVLGGVLGGLGGTATLTQNAEARALSTDLNDRLTWLDSGSGQMGDLVEQSH